MSPVSHFPSVFPNSMTSDRSLLCSFYLVTAVEKCRISAESFQRFTVADLRALGHTALEEWQL